jgi:hypothetical protein
MGSPADYTIILMLAVIGVAIWMTLDKLAELKREIAALKRKLDER